MTALTADRYNLKTHEIGFERPVALPVADNVHIYKGSLVCIDTNGYANIAADTASFYLAGIAEEGVDNTITGHTAGGQNIRVASGILVESLPIASAAQTDVGASVYVLDSGGVTKSPTNYVFAGTIVRYRTSTTVDVFIPFTGASAPLTAISGLTATAAELNKLHSVTPGTAAASDALVLGASKDIDTIKIDTSLVLASAASVAYGATMALVVATPVITVAGVNGTSATATINCAAVAPAGATLTIITTADASGTVTVTFGTHFKSTGTQATTASHESTISFIGDGTNWIEVGRATAM